ncbi:Nuclear cap-binding protein subunit 1 [Vitis vinifera]|uniref:Nuclear cap-binding protein subunit 1 n=1 Tax=Vitis vinifera TaxID=29760 RepID=A0A438KFZ5_VITVI|nr:Nuclear cap-binding protein subunit 1 [Vitis vinifera]
MKTRDEARVDCGEGNEEGETRGCSQHTWRCTRVIAAGRRRRRTAIGRRRGVSTPSPLESLEGVFAAPRLSARLKARLTNAFENFDAKSGSFSIKSLYSILEEERVDPFPTSVVWNAWVPPKYHKLDTFIGLCAFKLMFTSLFFRSNFQFIWPWEEWAYVLDLPKWAPQRVFVQEVLEREVRLSYWDKVKQGSLVGQGEPGKCGPSKWHMVLGLNPTTDDTLNLTGAGCCGVSIENAPTLEELLPPKGGPSFKYSTEDGKERNEQHALSMELSSMVKGRQVSREVITWIEESVIPVHGSEVALSVVVQTLLDIGSKSFTHLITVLERYGQVIAKLCHDQDKQVVLIDEILRNAVSKTYNRISDLRKEISSLKKSLALAEGDAVTRKAELEAAESKLTLVDGEPVLGENPALFLSLYKNFSNVLMERLPDTSQAGTLRGLKTIQADEMAVDLEESSNYGCGQ